MSTSKVIWSSPEIHMTSKIKSARKLYDSSLQSLKFQILLFIVIVLEIYFGFFQKFVVLNPRSLGLCRLTCKTLLIVNLVFLCCYFYQIVEAKYTIYITTANNQFLLILKNALFESIPQLKIFYDKFVRSKFYSYFSNKMVIDEEKIKAKEIEDRRKILTKSYFPSMLQQCGGYNEHLLHRSADNYGMFNNRELIGSTTITHTPENRFIRSAQSSTPFSNLKNVGSITFGGDITPIPSPLSSDIRCTYNNNNNNLIRYQTVSQTPQSSSYSPPQHSQRVVGARYSPGGLLLLSGKNQSGSSGVLTEVPSVEAWKRLGIDCRLLDEWTFSLKQWIHGTIIMRVVAEIDNLNRRLSELGFNDVIIGQSNVQTLRHLANQSINSLPTLGTLINFLDCSKDQAYVVNRLKELSQGCSLGKFQWNSGSSSVQHAWKEHLPNDTILILHMLCTYIEVRYTVHSNLHGVRTFSQQFITDNINKDINELRDVFMLYQTSVQPPHFKVIFNQAIYDIPAGRKNLFHCLLVFFYKIYNNEGNFKWLNLGRSGMNINFIFSK